MPQLPKESDGWIDARKFAMSPQTLDASEVDTFLEYLFSEVARRLEPPSLRECAAVARYMESLQILGVPMSILERGGEAVAAHDLRSESREDRSGRWCVGQMTKIVWGFLQQYGQFKTSTRGTALRFLRRHSETYLANPYIERTLAFIETHDLPPNAALYPMIPGMRSAHLSRGPINNADDDLSDRIFAAFYALPRAGIKKRSPRIAAALTASRIAARVGKVWSWADVNERVKAYARGQRRQHRKAGLSELAVESLFEQHKASRVDHWIFSFKFAREVRENSTPR